VEEIDSESVEELVEEGQDFEAGTVAGIEEADASQGEVRTKQVLEDDVPREYLGTSRPAELQEPTTGNIAAKRRDLCCGGSGMVDAWKASSKGPQERIDKRKVIPGQADGPEERQNEPTVAATLAPHRSSL
jgi:hypothetical protein